MRVLSFDYRPHARFIEPARGREQLWRLALGIVLVAGFFLVLSQLVFGTLLGLLEPQTANAILRDASTGQTVCCCCCFSWGCWPSRQQWL